MEDRIKFSTTVPVGQGFYIGPKNALNTGLPTKEETSETIV